MSKGDGSYGMLHSHSLKTVVLGVFFVFFSITHLFLLLCVCVQYSCKILLTELKSVFIFVREFIAVCLCLYPTV